MDGLSQNRFGSPSSSRSWRASTKEIRRNTAALKTTGVTREHRCSSKLSVMIAIPRHTVDLSSYPDLVVIYLGMQVRNFKGLATFLTLGPEIDQSVAARPEGLLCHERVYYSLFPLHAGM